MGCLALRPAIDERGEATVPGSDEDAVLRDIRGVREALAACPQGHPDRATHAHWLGYKLHMRHLQTGDVSLIDEGIEAEREALALRPPGHPHRALSCANLGISLGARYQHCGDLGLLDEAIGLKREALGLRPPGHPDRAVSCSNLGSSLGARYKQCGDLGLLDESIGLEREALALQPPGHPDRALGCGNLESSVYARYKQCGDLDLLDEAIELEREALALRSPGHPDRALSCDSLGSSLHARYQQCGNLGLLDEAIELHRTALALRPPGHLNRAYSCSELGHSLRMRYQQCGDLGLLDEAIELDREALALRPPGHPDRALTCKNLSYSLIDCYRHNKITALLDEAVALCSHSLQQGPSLEAWRSFLCLSALYMIPNTSHFSLASALSYLNLSFAGEFDNVHAFIRETRINLSRVWEASSVWASDTPLQLCNMYTQLIDRLPLAAGFVLDTSSRLQTLKSTHHIGTDACVAAILAKQPSQAIELLDRAHGLVWAQALHQRDPQTEGAPPELAAELAHHLRAIAAPVPTQLGNTLSLVHHQDAHHKRNTRIQAILREIRAMPRRERFMLGASYDTLRMAAREHPVIVLVAGRGYAFALIMSNATEDQPHALRLDLTSDDLSALRVSAEQAGLRSRADMRNCDSGTRIRYQKTDTDDNHKSHRVFREIWRKIIQPILRYLQLEVCTLTRCNLA
jgi:tetratricopeptide (TPR) repeat protein